MVQRCLAGAVPRTPQDGDQRQPRSHEDQGGRNTFLRLPLQDGEEMGGEVDVGEVVDGKLLAHNAQINVLWLGEIQRPLDPRIQENAIQIWIRLANPVKVSR